MDIMLKVMLSTGISLIMGSIIFRLILRKGSYLLMEAFLTGLFFTSIGGLLIGMPDTSVSVILVIIGVFLVGSGIIRLFTNEKPPESILLAVLLGYCFIFGAVLLTTQKIDAKKTGPPAVVTVPQLENATLLKRTGVVTNAEPKAIGMNMVLLVVELEADKVDPPRFIDVVAPATHDMGKRWSAGELISIALVHYDLNEHRAPRSHSAWFAQ